MNLAVNARDAMPNGGSLSIDVGDKSFSEDSLQDSPEPLFGDYIQISVSDNGIGMAEQVLSHLFEPFFTTKEVGKGTGLGLSIVYAIVKQFNGHVTVQSELSKGTVFRLYFPKASSQTLSSDESVTDVGSLLGSETILLVEDELGVQSLVQSALKRNGYTILVANNGKEAFSIMESAKNRIDLLITDIVMPDIRGNLVAEQFRRQFSNAPVVFISGYSEQTIVTDKQDITTTFLQKPFSINALLSAIKRLIEAKKEGESEL
jgi:CheY-like chemotaxis protein